MKKYGFSDIEGKISISGFPEVEKKNGYSDGRDVIYIGERNYDDPLLKDELEGFGGYRTDNSWTAKKASKYIRKIIRSLNRHLMKEAGVKLRYRDLTIKEMERPKVAITEDGRLGVVLGYYDTETKELYLNPCLDEETLKRVATHEIVHYAQDKLGIIGNYVERFGKKARPLIESQAEAITERIIPEVYSSRAIENLLYS